MFDDLTVRTAQGPRYSPNALERDAQAILDRLIPERDAETDKCKHKQLSSRVKTARVLRDWARSRTGYVGGR